MKHSSTPITTSRALTTLLLTGILAVPGISLPATAGAYATIAPPPTPSAASGLPDGRVYELVSPANKHGYQAGATGRSEESPLAIKVGFSVASPDGDAVAFTSAGPAAETDSSGLSQNFVAERTSHGWGSRSTTARGVGLNEKLGAALQATTWLDYSPDLSHLAYAINSADVPGAPAIGLSNFYLLGPNPLEEPAWLLRSAISQSEGYTNTELVGMTPDASIIYIAYEGRLLPQDASRSGWGLYEYRSGTLSEVGVLPDRSVPTSGAQPVATSTSGSENSHNPGENNPASQDNQLSENGMRLFFVSSGQLYVHKIEPNGSQRSVLISASQLPGHVGEPAPNGVALFENLTQNAATEGPEQSAPTYAYASPDGSHVFFQSTDQLTGKASNDSAPKVYDFDVDTETLEYLPGVALGGIVTAAKDGSSFVFVNGASSPRRLDLWSAGANGGSVSQITQLPGNGFVGPGRMISDDSVLVFQTQAPIAGFNNAGTEQIYRYDINTNLLDCVSCPPAGVQPSGNAYLSAIDQFGSQFGFGQDPGLRAVNDARGVSGNGERIFFASPDPLVVHDTNSNLDVYEWENGTIFLISSGTSSDYSLFLDNSESGGDVFFATSDELVKGDNDGGFDVYDARIPRSGDNPPPTAVPCTGDVCQGPPSVPQLLGAPPSATFNGAENAVEPPVPASLAKQRVRPPTRAQKLSQALRACASMRIKHKRRACEKSAHKRYGRGK